MEELAAVHAEEFAQMEHKLLSETWMMFDLRWGVNLHAFVKTLDPTQPTRAVQEAAGFALWEKLPLACVGLRSSSRWRSAVNVAMRAGVDMNTTLPMAPVVEEGMLEEKTKLFAGFQAVMRDEVPVVIDTGASFSLSPFEEDFIGPIKKAPLESLQGLNAEAAVLGEGIVEWHIQDIYGVTRAIRTRAMFVPSATIRLFSPQCFLQEQNGGQVTVKKNKTVLELTDGTEMEFPFNHHSNLPLMLLGREMHLCGLIPDDHKNMMSQAFLEKLISVESPENANLTHAQKELLLWHKKWGHAGFQHCQALLCKQADGGPPKVKPKNERASSCNTEGMLCTACCLAKAARRSGKRQKQAAVFDDMVIRKGDLHPGDAVSIDQFMSTTPGRLPHTKGKEPKKDKFRGGTIMVDHATGFIHCFCQVSLRTGETLKAKTSFEQFADQFGVTLKHFRADNAPFGAEAFRENIKMSGQTIDFSGVGAHHQNGVAENAIKTVTNWARAMLLNQAVSWPEQFNLELWPFAVMHAVHLWNNLPKRDTKLAPIELFTREKFMNYNHLKQVHVWGCPVFVLDPKLQDGKKVPKWDPRTRRGLYLGQSPEHSSTVGLILNIRTGHVSPQFHVVHDDLFSTVPGGGLDGFLIDGVIPTEEWEQLFELGCDRVVDGFDPEDIPPLHNDWLTDREIAARDQFREERRCNPPPHGVQTPSTQAPEGAGAERAPEGASTEDRRSNAERAPEGAGTENRSVPERTETEDGRTVLEDELPASVDDIADDELSLVDNKEVVEDPVESSGDRRSQRTRVKRNFFHEEFPTLGHVARAEEAKQIGPHLKKNTERGGGYENERFQANDVVRSTKHDRNRAFLMGLRFKQLTEVVKGGSLANLLHFVNMVTDQRHGTIEDWHPALLATQANAADNPTWEEAMNGPDKVGYWEAAVTEIQTLKDKECWDVVDREHWMNVLPGTWAFKCKRYPDGRIKKFKGRFCARGDRQIDGVDVFDTFAPVTNWMTIRLLLTLSMILGLASRQVDYTAAFIHAPIEEDVFVEMPRGFTEPGKVLKLKKSLYGLRQSPKNFFNFISERLENVGLVPQVDVDPCLFISDKVICVLYVDDTLFWSPKSEWIDEVIEKLRNQEKVELEDEESVAGFLGVHIERNEADQTIKLSQSGLTKRIIEALNIERMPACKTPAAGKPLVKDENGDPPDGNFSYPSVIGMLQFLQSHSRPDITFAVSQCARFTHAPKRSHEIAVERIGRYLKGTIDEGLIMKPSDDCKMDVFVDADFAGLWPHEDKDDPTCVKSRTGHVICIADCPIVWGSKIQPSVALSTTEAEFNALSAVMRIVIPLRELAKTVGKSLGIEEQVSNFKTTVWEDNQGCLILANMERGRTTPRSKHFAIKQHWFKEHLVPGKVVVEKIGTEDQKANMMTKSLGAVQFVRERKMLCGW